MSEQRLPCSITSFTITRSKWSGRDGFPNNRKSCLENEFGDMCCLGFLSKAAAPNKDRLALNFPYTRIYSEAELGPFSGGRMVGGGGDGYSAINHDLARLNDDKSLDQVTKEELITRLFAKNGVTVIWED